MADAEAADTFSRSAIADVETASWSRWASDQIALA